MGNAGDSSCDDGAITFHVVDTTPPVITAPNEDDLKTLQECAHDHTLTNDVITAKTRQHTTAEVANLEDRAEHAGGNNAFDHSHFGGTSGSYEDLHMYYHSDVSCEDKCAGLVWTADPWTTDFDGVVIAATYPKFRESIALCKSELGNGLFCSDGARSTESGDDDFQSLVQTRTINYFCRDYAGNEAEENGHVIHVVDTSPPKLALSHLCHDNGVHGVRARLELPARDGTLTLTLGPTTREQTVTLTTPHTPKPTNIIVPSTPHSMLGRPTTVVLTGIAILVRNLALTCSFLPATMLNSHSS